MILSWYYHNLIVVFWVEMGREAREHFGMI
jgi:hypothetical protein